MGTRYHEFERVQGDPDGQHSTAAGVIPLEPDRLDAGNPLVRVNGTGNRPGARLLGGCQNAASAEST